MLPKFIADYCGTRSKQSHNKLTQS